MSLIPISDSTVVKTTTSGGDAGTGFFGFSPVTEDSYVVRFAKTRLTPDAERPIVGELGTEPARAEPVTGPGEEQRRGEFHLLNGFAVDGAKA